MSRQNFSPFVSVAGGNITGFNGWDLWEGVMSCIQAHQSELRNIWIKMWWQLCGCLLTLCVESNTLNKIPQDILSPNFNHGCFKWKKNKCLCLFHGGMIKTVVKLCVSTRVPAFGCVGVKSRKTFVCECVFMTPPLCEEGFVKFRAVCVRGGRCPPRWSHLWAVPLQHLVTKPPKASSKLSSHLPLHHVIKESRWETCFFYRVNLWYFKLSCHIGCN